MLTRTEDMRGEIHTLVAQEVAYHRNGVGGDGFYAVTFNDSVEGDMVGVVFKDLAEREDAQCPVAVFNREKLGQGVIAFGVNSWRGDTYSGFLYDAIKEYEKKREEKFNNG